MLQRHLPTLLLGLKHQSWNVNVQAFLVEITGDLELDGLVGGLSRLLVIDPRLISSIDGISDCHKDAFDGVVVDVSVNDEPLFILLLFHFRK